MIAVDLESLYAGEIARVAPNPASRALVDALWARIGGVFADPDRATGFAEITALRRAVVADPVVLERAAGVLLALGADPEHTVFDRVRVRMVPPGLHRDPAAADAFRAHRDSWYANPAAQINVWIALRPVPIAAGCGFWPQYWNVPVPNGSHEFEYDEWNRLGGWQNPHAQKRYPHADIPLPPAWQAEMDEAELLLFSATHLHGTVGHDTPRTRWSCEIRAVRLDHVARMAETRRIDDRSRGSTLPELIPLRHFTRS